MSRRLVITVCPLEAGVVRLPIERGGRPRRLDARAIAAALEALIARRGLGQRVRVREGCAGGCGGRGPNVSVALHAAAQPGERADNVAIGWKTYVYSLAALPCLAAVIDESLDEPAPRGTTRRRRAR
jgi:hypothetical protein